MRPDIVDRDDVGVIDERARPRLAREPRVVFFGGGQARGQHLQRDVAVEPRVVRPVDLAHPTLPDQVLHLIRAQLGPGGDVHNCARRLTRGIPVTFVITTRLDRANRCSFAPVSSL